MEPRITLITLGVRDLERSVRFYRDGLGLPLPGEPEGIAMFEMGGTRLSLYPREALAEDATVRLEAAGGAGQPEGAPATPVFRDFTLSHNVDSPEKVDALLRRAVDAGATLVKPGQEAFWGGYSGYFADPDGFLWEVAWNPHLPL